MPNRYIRLAEVYDWPGAVAFSHAAHEMVRAAVARHSVPRGRCLDLACGTGTLAIALAREGWRVTGLDLSPAMLARARAKAKAMGEGKAGAGVVPIRWLEADMRSFTLDEPVTLVTCFYDALNHLSRRDELAQTFHRVADALVPGGLLLFDVNTEAGYQSLWRHGTDLVETEDYTWVAEADYDARSRRAMARVVGFIRQPDGRYEKFEESLAERLFTDEEIGAAARQCGLTVVSREGWTPFPVEADGEIKTFWVLRKA